MPTGYTADIANDISFEKFVMNCARAFGACVTMRDDPSDKEIPKFEPSKFNAEKLEEAKTELGRLKKMGVATATKLAKKEFEEAINANEKIIEEKNILKMKYEKMLAEVNKWKSPSCEHDGLKKFMREQILQSIDFDCGTKYYHDHAPKRLTGEEWLSAKIEKCLWDIDHHTKENNEEINRVNSRNTWVKQLRGSLGL